jgi:hypothetical protein
MTNFSGDGWRKPAMTYAQAADAMGISVHQVRTAGAVKKVALPEIVAAIWDGRIKTIGHAYSIVTPTKDENRDGLTSEAKQRKWLEDPSNLSRKPRQKKPPAPPTRITDRALKELSDLECAVVVDKLMPRANRALALEGEQWLRGPIKSSRVE